MRAVALLVAAAGLAPVGAGCGGSDERPSTPAGAKEPRASAPIDVGGTPVDLAVHEGALWVLSAGEKDVVVKIDDRANSLARKPIGLGTSSGCCAIGPSSVVATGKTLWVANRFRNAVTPIDASSGKRVGRRIPLAPPGSAGHRVDPITLALSDSELWAVHAHFDTLWRIDVRSRKTEGPTRVGERPFGVAVGEGFVWVTNGGDGTVTRVDPRSRKAVGPPIRVGMGPTGIAVADGVVWVANVDSDTVTRIDAASGTVIGEPIKAGDEPYDVAVSNGIVWVANAADGTVVRIDAETGESVGKPIEVGERPQSLAVDEDGAIWAANTGDGTVIRIEP